MIDQTHRQQLPQQNKGDRIGLAKARRNPGGGQDIKQHQATAKVVVQRYAGVVELLAPPFGHQQLGQRQQQADHKQDGGRQRRVLQTPSQTTVQR